MDVDAETEARDGGDSVANDQQADAVEGKSYLDRLIEQVGGGDEDEDDGSWMDVEDDSPDANASADDDDDSGTSVAAGSDDGEEEDEPEYDFDDLSADDRSRFIETYADYKISIRDINSVVLCIDHEVPEELSDEAKEHLTWRLDEKSFSDWTIVVSSEDDASIEPKEYNVHRVILATGPKKSAYFEGILNSGQFVEAGDSTSRIELPTDILSSFSTFLDFLYVPLPEAKKVITKENVMQLRYLSDRFLVPKLKESVYEFIKEDMTSLDRLADYLTIFVEEGEDDLVAHAAVICIENLLHIGKDSPLLYSMPPAFLWHILSYASSQALAVRNGDPKLPDFSRRLHRLVISYLKEHGERLDERYFLVLFSTVKKLPLKNGASFVIAKKYLSCFKQYGWDTRFRGARSVMGTSECLETWCVDVIYDYMASRRSSMSDSDFDSIISAVPPRVASALLGKLVRNHPDTTTV